MAEDNSGVKRGGVSGKFKVSSRELQASKAKRDCLDNADDTFKKKKKSIIIINKNISSHLISSWCITELEEQLNQGTLTS